MKIFSARFDRCKIQEWPNVSVKDESVFIGLPNAGVTQTPRRGQDFGWFETWAGAKMATVEWWQERVTKATETLSEYVVGLAGAREMQESP